MHLFKLDGILEYQAIRDSDLYIHFENSGQVELTKKVTEQVKVLGKDEDDQLTEAGADDIAPAYDQARALGRTTIDVDRIAAGLPCGSEGYLLMFARWRKLERDIYNERKG